MRTSARLAIAAIALAACTIVDGTHLDAGNQSAGTSGEGLPQSCSSRPADVCCGGLAEHSCAGTIDERIDDLHALDDWPLRCELPTPCPTLLVEYRVANVDNPSYSASSFACIVGKLRDRVPGRYLIVSSDDTDVHVADYVFELLSDDQLLQATYEPGEGAETCTWTWSAGYLGDPAALDACLALPIEADEQIACLLQHAAAPQLGCPPLSSC